MCVCVCFGDLVVAAGHPPSMDLVSSTGVSECAYLCVCVGDWVVAAGHPPSMDPLSSTGVSECAYLCVCVLVIRSSLQAIHPLWICCPAQVCLSVLICVCVGDWVVAAGHPPSMDSLSSTGMSECAYLCVCW